MLPVRKMGVSGGGGTEKCQVSGSLPLPSQGPRRPHSEGAEQRPRLHPPGPDVLRCSDWGSVTLELLPPLVPPPIPPQACKEAK